MSCYRKLTSSSEIQRQSQNEISNQHYQPTQITYSNLTWPATLSSTGIFRKVCLFYNKEHKTKVRKRNKN